MTGAPLAPSPPRPSLSIVLVEPQLGENIGAAARAMGNFGLTDLRLVAPRDGWPSDRARSSASGADHVIDATRVYGEVREAVGDLNFVLASTARPRDMMKPVLTPESAVRDMLARSLDGQACGVLFGRERNGLDNDEIALADAIVMAPVDPGFASLNLAQAVLLVAYEWMKQGAGGGLGRATEFDGPGEEGLGFGRRRPATREQLYGFFDHLERELDLFGFLRPPEKRPVMVRSIRNMFHRIGATEQDISTLRGIVTALIRGQRQEP